MRVLNSFILLAAFSSNFQSHAMDGVPVSMDQIPKGVQDAPKTCIDGSCENLTPGKIRINEGLSINAAQPAKEIQIPFRAPLYTGTRYLKNGVPYQASERPEAPYLKIEGTATAPTSFDANGAHKLVPVKNPNPSQGESMFSWGNHKITAVNSVAQGNTSLGNPFDSPMSAKDFIKHLGPQGAYEVQGQNGKNKLDMKIFSDGSEGNPQAVVEESASKGSQQTPKKHTYEFTVR